MRESQTALRDAIQKMREDRPNPPIWNRSCFSWRKSFAPPAAKKQYGYLKSPVKKLVDEIVEELAKDPAVSEAYRHWYALQEEVLRTYRDDLLGADTPLRGKRSSGRSKTW